MKLRVSYLYRYDTNLGFVWALLQALARSIGRRNVSWTFIKRGPAPYSLIGQFGYVGFIADLNHVGR